MEFKVQATWEANKIRRPRTLRTKDSLNVDRNQNDETTISHVNDEIEGKKHTKFQLPHYTQHSSSHVLSSTSSDGNNALDSSSISDDNSLSSSSSSVSIKIPIMDESTDKKSRLNGFDDTFLLHSKRNSKLRTASYRYFLRDGKIRKRAALYYHTLALGFAKQKIAVDLFAVPHCGVVKVPVSST